VPLWKFWPVPFAGAIIVWEVAESNMRERDPDWLLIGIAIAVAVFVIIVRGIMRVW
jgi:preprotein translocase subunit Sec61beta